MFSPTEMLALGVFDGSYYTDYTEDFTTRPVVSVKNCFAPSVSQSRQKWLDNGWITEHDPLGWFQWYVRYHAGRRLESLDKWQIGRQRSFVARHGAQVKKNGNGDLTKRMRQRQCLLHWAADPIPDIAMENKFEFLLQRSC